MKTVISSILSLFFCFPFFAQEMENSFYENGTDVGGDALINSSFVEVKGGKIFKTFKIETSVAGDYYLDAWMVAPATAIGYAEYEVEVNGITTGYSFKPQTSDWQSLALTDTKKNIVTINLKKGENTISIIGNSSEILLNINSISNDKALVIIYNTFGGLEFEENHIISKGDQTLLINTSNFRKGVYVIQVSIGGESVSKIINI